MSWRVEFRPEVEHDVAAASWYEKRRPGLGRAFVEEIIAVWDALADQPLLNCRRRPVRNIRWRYPECFPYRVIYEVNESQHCVLVAAVLHAARHNRHWLRRI